MHSDCAFVIGKAHRVCQDYARSGDEYCLMSDGCSSSPDTDVGARLLVLAAEEVLRHLPHFPCLQNQDDFHKAAITLATCRAKEMGLPAQAVDATLLWLLARGDGWIHANMLGDGAVAWQDRGSNLINVMQVTFEDGCPAYPSYLLDERRFRRGGARTQNLSVKPDGSLAQPHSRSWHWTGASLGVPFAMNSVSFVAILTDGLASMTQRDDTETSKGEQPVELAHVVRGVLGFKGTQGEFVKRRLQGFLRESKAVGREFNDDLSVAAIWCGEEPKP